MGQIPSFDHFLAAIAAQEEAAASYQIERSIRMSRSRATRMRRTFALGDRRKWTWASWLKISELGLSETILLTAFNGTFADRIAINAAFGGGVNTIGFYSGATTQTIYSTILLRDPTAFGHLCVRYDSANATAADRIIFEWNGVRLTNTGTLTQNTDGSINQAVASGMFSGSTGVDGYEFGGYAAETYFLDGVLSAASGFTEIDATTGALVPKRYTGALNAGSGVNGGFWSYANNASTTTLGQDDGTGAVGAGAGSNDWTLTNFSVTAGVGNDSLTDTPTNYGTDTGLGGEVRGNYCTLNPIFPLSAGLADGNLSHVQTTNNRGNVGTIPIMPGEKKVFEFTCTALPGGTEIYVGVNTPAANLQNAQRGGRDTGYLYGVDGQKWLVNTGTAYGATWGISDTIRVEVDRVNNLIQCFKNNSSQGTFAIPSTGELYPSVHTGGSASAIGGYMNFGQRPFANQATAGFTCICTQNLPDPAIPNPKSGFEAKLRTGTGSAANVTGLLFQPGLYIGKSRSAATDFAWYDSVRGVQKQVESNTTSAETTEAQGVTAFNSDGISIGTLAQLNTNAATYLDLFFRFGVAYGIEAVAYTGNGSNRTIAHNLGVAPKMIIVFDLTTGGSHRVYHAGMDASPQNGVMYLDSTAAYAAAATVWNSTAPTSSVFSLGTDVRVNTNTSSYIAFLFADVEGFSKFGSFTGNASADGPYVYCGFRPGLTLIKNAAATGDWFAWDSVREAANPRAAELLANTTAAEAATADIDLTALGFKVRATTAGFNGSTNRIAFASFAKEAGKYSRAA